MVKKLLRNVLPTDFLMSAFLDLLQSETSRNDVKTRKTRQKNFPPAKRVKFGHSKNFHENQFFADFGQNNLPNQKSYRDKISSKFHSASYKHTMKTVYHINTHDFVDKVIFRFLVKTVFWIFDPWWSTLNPPFKPTMLAYLRVFQSMK